MPSLHPFRRLVPLILLCALPLTGRTATHAELEQRFQEANAKLDAGEPQPALEIYNGILEAEPKAGNVWVMRAVAKWRLKDPSGARADLAQAIALHPDNVDAYRVRGQVRYEAGDYPGSLADFAQAIEVMETNAKSVAEVDAGAAREYERENAGLFGMRAEVQNKLDDHAAAIRDLTRAIELKPDYAAALYLRGELVEASGDSAAAEADYSKVIELDPQHADALNQRAWIRFHASDWEAAIADGRAALKVAPRAVIPARLVGYAQFGAGDYAAAAATLGEAAEFGARVPAQQAYALFIRHFALKRTGATDDRVSRARAGWESDAWLQAIAQWIEGRLSEDELDLQAEAGAEDERAGRECEAHFYIGLQRLLDGDRATARLRFKAAVLTQEKSFVEYTLAEAELARLAR